MDLTFLAAFLGFGVLALASKEIGARLNRLHLPLISGFLLAGVLVGPYGLGFLREEQCRELHFVIDFSLGMIALAAGGELHLSELRRRVRSVIGYTLGLVVFTFVLGSVSVYFLASWVPFLEGNSSGVVVAAAILTGAILVARSPSSAIAIVRELRAKGPFTQTVLGVTVVMDAVVIVIFAINAELAVAFAAGASFTLGFTLSLLGDFLLSILLGLTLWRAIVFVLGRVHRGEIRAALVVGLAYVPFALSGWLDEHSHDEWGLEIHVESLLACMLAGVLTANRSRYRTEFTRILHDTGPPIFVCFFTLTGASLQLDVLAETWPLALALCAVRLGGIVLGSSFAGVVARVPEVPARARRNAWMAFITQAGVGIGLAQELAHQFPGWGADLATVIVAAIVVNQFVGPPLFKWVIQLAGESHARAHAAAFDGVKDALIFGSGGGQSVALARQLNGHGWKARVATFEDRDAPVQRSEGMIASDVEQRSFSEIDRELLRELEMEHVDAVVILLPDAAGYELCELIYEHYGIDTVVVRIQDPASSERFRELGALVVDPSTAMINLLEHFVLSPAVTSMLLGLDHETEIIEYEVLDRELHGVFLRDLKLPDDVLVLSVRRDGHNIISHGYTELKLHDRVAVLGTPEDHPLAEVVFSASSHPAEDGRAGG